FERMCQLLGNMKDETARKALQRAEGYHRPNITKADKAMGRALISESKANDNAAKINKLAECHNNLVNETDRRWNYLTSFAIAESKQWELLAQLMLNENTISSERDLTYHISSRPQRKVGPSHSPRSGRLFLSSGSACRTSSPNHRQHHRRIIPPYKRGVPGG
ncbi:MAG: hypothetical protein ACYS1A_17850, partial [Planctomycetota bacterium]